MAVINILSPHVADMIAAGEVVERPASVIKELMENAFDAKASAVTVEIRDGGATYIRVSDNGCGMSPEDAGIAFLRHATSKLHDEHGLEAIGTMGFRGEALAAISAVSETELRTRRPGDDEGTFVRLAAGDIEDMGPVGCPEGTTMIVRRLFYNTPARLKFLKSDRSEAAACVQTALRCALGRPEVSVRFIRDGKEEFFTPGDGLRQSCIYSLLGRELAKDMLPCRWDEDGLKLSGFVSSPAAARGNRSAQYFYCNGRFIRSALLQTAVEQAFRNCLLSGRFPACVMYIDINASSVDVNVHPAKTEVKFSEEKRVFDMVYHAVSAALTREDRNSPPEEPAAKTPAAEKPSAVPVLPSNPAVRAGSVSRPDFYRSMSAKDYREQIKGSSHTSSPLHSPKTTYQIAEKSRTGDEKNEKTEKKVDSQPTVLQNPAADVEKTVQNVENPVSFNHKILGEAFMTYIIVEQGEQLILIDKHAAHERMIFDRLRQRDVPIMAQTLLDPPTLRLRGDEAELLEANSALLYGLGFELEPFGDEEFILRTVPADMLPGDAAAAVEEMLDKLSRGKAPDAQSMRDEMLRTVACKAAIKAGWDNDESELRRVADEVLSGRVKYCPHGRPVSALITKKELEKMFRRIL